MKGLIHNFFNLVWKKNLSISVFVALALTIGGYFTNNWSILTGEELRFYTCIEAFKRLFNADDNMYPGALFVNTSFDKELIPVYDGVYEVGKTEITDRKKLLEFLRLLSKTDYAYTIIDLRFAEGLSSPDSDIDSELFQFIKGMPRCVVATHRNLKLLDGLESKAALADYKSTVTSTNFIRYEYFDSIPSIPLYVYNELQKGAQKDTISYSKKILGLPIYTQAHKLCQNSLFLDFSSNGFPKLKKIQTESGNFTFIEKYGYRNLGFDFINYLDDFSEERVIEMIEGNLKEKGNGNPNNTIVYIGNVLEDLHDTYAGLQPGVVILYKALSSLQNGHNIVNTTKIIILFLIYTLLCFFVLQDISIFNLLPKKFIRKHQLIFFFIQIIPITLLLFIFDIVEIKLFHTTTNFFLASTILALIKLHVRFKNRSL